MSKIEKIKYSLEDYIIDKPLILAIKTSLSDYKIAYNINKELKINLKREKNILKYKENMMFTSLVWYNKLYEEKWNLLKNQSINSIIKKSNDIIDVGIVHTTTLVKDKIQYNYFLRIFNYSDSIPIDAILQKIQKIQNVTIAIRYDCTKDLKKILNLILD